MTPQTFIFTGRSGCGKGTQCVLLKEYLKKIDTQNETLYVQSGVEIREFIKGPSYTQRLDKILYDTGAMQPEFLIVYLWANVLAHQYKENQHIIFDGMPRKYHEAGVLDSVFKFYNLDKCFVINLQISKEEAVKRLLSRKRIDDNLEEINRRLQWYETEVVPTMDFFNKNPRYDVININGERPVEEIHKDIVEKIALK